MSAGSPRRFGSLFERQRDDLAVGVGRGRGRGSGPGPGPGPGAGPGANAVVGDVGGSNRELAGPWAELAL